MTWQHRWLMIGLATGAAVALKLGASWLALYWGLLVVVYATDQIIFAMKGSRKW
jgi:hypothetical protein